jgi:hypothetical protein
VGLILKSVEAGGDTSRNNSSAAGTCDSGAGNSTTRDTTVEGVGAITGASVRLAAGGWITVIFETVVFAGADTKGFGGAASGRDLGSLRTAEEFTE